MDSIYLLIFILLIGSVSANLIAPRTRNYVWIYIVIVFMMVLCAGLRADNVDRDYLPYQEYYIFGPSKLGLNFFQEWATSFPYVDIGWIAINTLFKSVGLSFEILVFSVALVSVSIYSLFFWKTIKYPTFALLIYYSHIYFNREMLQMRSGLACAILLWAVYYMSKDEYIKVFFCLLVAALLHLASLLFLLPILLCGVKWRPTAVMIILLLVLAILLSTIIDERLTVLSLLDRIAVYQDSELSQPLGIITNLVTIKQLLIIGLVWKMIWTHGIEKKSKVMSILYVSYFISTMWIILFNNFGILAGRGATILSLGEPWLLAELVAFSVGNKSYGTFKWLIVISIVALSVFMFIVNVYIKQTVGQYHSVLFQ